MMSPLGRRALALPGSGPVALPHPPLVQQQAGFQGHSERCRRHPLTLTSPHPLNVALVGCQLVFALHLRTSMGLRGEDHGFSRCVIPVRSALWTAELYTRLIISPEARAPGSAARCHGVRERAPGSRSVPESVGDHALRCVDPDDVQVTEIDALLVQERGARAAFSPHVRPCRPSGSCGGRSWSRKNCAENPGVHH